MSDKWHLDNNGTGETYSIYEGDILIADVYGDVLGFQIVADHNAAARLAAIESENARLQEIAKGSWRFWAALQDGYHPTLDRGYYVVRVAAKAYDAFDTLFRVSKALATIPAAPAGGSAED